MRVFLSVDAEGIAGINTWTEMDKDAPTLRRLMTAEVNAAIQGLHDSGAALEEVVVCDAHGGGRNILAEALDPLALLVRGDPRRRFMVAGLDASFDLLFCIGYHPRAGTRRGNMSHTYSGSSVHEIRVNGEPIGELDINAGLAAHHGVALALVTGDDLLREQVAQRAPWTEYVVSKYGISQYAAKNRHPTRVREEIRRKASAAARNPERYRTVEWERPLRVEFALCQPSQADRVEALGLERTDGRTFRFEVPDWLAFYDRLSTITGLASGAS